MVRGGFSSPSNAQFLAQFPNPMFPYYNNPYSYPMEYANSGFRYPYMNMPMSGAADGYGMQYMPSYGNAPFPHALATPSMAMPMPYAMESNPMFMGQGQVTLTDAFA